MARRRRHGANEPFVRGKYNVHTIVQNLRELGEHVLTAAKQALKDGADLIVNDAKSRCPVRTGKLRDSIKAVRKKDGALYRISADARNKNDIPYGQFVEFDPRISNGGFLYPAMEANRDAVNNSIRQAVHDAIARGH